MCSCGFGENNFLMPSDLNVDPRWEKRGVGRLCVIFLFCLLYTPPSSPSSPPSTKCAAPGAAREEGDTSLAGQISQISPGDEQGQMRSQIALTSCTLHCLLCCSPASEMSLLISQTSTEDSEGNCWRPHLLSVADLGHTCAGDWGLCPWLL